MENSLIKVDKIELGKWSKTANLLIEKLASGAGIFYEPTRIKREAKAIAKVKKIEALSQIEINDLHHRAMERFVNEEAIKQNNIETIIGKAIPMLEENSKPQDINNDWLLNFTDKSKFVSDEQMQELWAKILAGEANAPGNFSKRTINTLSDLDKEDVEIFSKLCSFEVSCLIKIPLILQFRDEFYETSNLIFYDLSHLESIGLIQYNEKGFMYDFNNAFRARIRYFNESIYLMPKNNNAFIIGQVKYTKVGEQLAALCDRSFLKGFIEYLRNKWEELGYSVSDEDPISDSSEITSD